VSQKKEARGAVAIAIARQRPAARTIGDGPRIRAGRTCDFDNFDTGIYEPARIRRWNRSLAQSKLVWKHLRVTIRVWNRNRVAHDGPCGAGRRIWAWPRFAAFLRGPTGLFYDYRDLLHEIQAS